MVTSVATVAGKVLRKENIGSRNERAISLHLFDSMFLIEVFAPVFSGAWLINTQLNQGANEREMGRMVRVKISTLSRRYSVEKPLIFADSR